MEALLAVEEVGQAFGATRVLDGLSLRVRTGTRHALIGPNGTGKTTLLNAISGWLRPQRGDIRFRGTSLLGRPPHQIARLGVARASQIPVGFPRLTAREHLRAAAQRGRGWWRFAAGVEARVRDHAARLGLSDALDTPVGALSHGDGKRLELAGALALDPELLLLDEPTAGLSRSETSAMIAALRALKGITLLIVEHDMDVVAQLADRVSALHGGRVLAEGRLDEVAADARVQAVYLGDRAVR